MASFRYERRIAAPASTVWDVVRDPTTIPQWFPGIERCHVEGNLRTITTATGLEMPEEIMVVDDVIRRFVYRITSPLFTFHLGTIDVIELGPEESLCVYATTAEPDTLALLIAGGTDRALDEISRVARGETR